MISRPKVADFLGLRRNTVLLLAALLVAGTGEKLWLGFVPKYLQTLGAAIFIVGLYDALQTLLGALYAYPGGWLTDHWGERRSLMIFSLLSLAGYLVVLAWHHWLAVLLGSFLFLAWSALSLPTTFSVVASSLQQTKHTMGIGVQSMIRRVPMMLGPLIGGWLITRYGWQHGIQLSLLGCLLLTVATMILQSRLADPSAKSSAPNAAAPPTPASFLCVVKSFNPALRELLVSDILIRFCERIPYLTHALGISPLGKVVGYGTDFVNWQHAFLWIPDTPKGTNGTMFDLNDLVPGNSAWTLLTAVAMNSSGQIAGSALNAGSQEHAVLLSPLPTPRLIAPRFLANGAFRFTVVGSAGSKYTVQASTDFSTWKTITNFARTAGIDEVVDSTAASQRQRFYRVTSP